MGYTGTEKKNPFVMTIGFNKNDPEHVEVAEFLNSLPRKKAQYIVEAVRCYRGMQQENAGDVKEEKNAGKQPDKEAIRQIVLEAREKATLVTQNTNTDTAPDVWTDANAGMTVGFDQGDLDAIFGGMSGMKPIYLSGTLMTTLVPPVSPGSIVSVPRHIISSRSLILSSAMCGSTSDFRFSKPGPLSSTVITLPEPVCLV